MAVQRERHEAVNYGDVKLTGGLSVFSRAFDSAFTYEGDDLGASWSPEGTFFRLWAPTAWEAGVALYEAAEGPPVEVRAMSRGVQGTWTLRLEGDLAGLYYTYRVRIGEDWTEAADPYAKAVGLNGDRGCILDLRSTDPERWTTDKPPLAAPEDMIVYELHVRDLSSHPDSGIAAKGRYLGLAERGTTGPDGIATGLDYLAGLGVTHVQLLPVVDYSTRSVDERDRTGSQYNWGYDPKNPFAPEGSYASDPADPAARIRELKTAIQALHDRGLRVILDVVFNHVHDAYRSCAAMLVPGYYVRYREDGTLSDVSRCGNDLATERPMARKWVVDAILHWAKEYRVDGFRFDLMGLIDRDTINQIRQRLDRIDPTIVMLGEGWIMGENEPNKPVCADQRQAYRMPRVAMFNDCTRDALRGDFAEPASAGFVSGNYGLAEEVKRGVVGGVPYSGKLRLFASQPGQTVNYAEVHDNHTLWDKLALSVPERSQAERTCMHRLASAIVLTSQGIPFLHAGQEFMRTKHGIENSYRSPESVNWLDWKRCAERQADVRYMRELIALRRAHPAFRLRTAAEIREHLRFEPSPEHAIAFTLRDHAGGDSARHLYVLYHAAGAGSRLELPALGAWRVLFEGARVLALTDTELAVGGIGAVVLAVD